MFDETLRTFLEQGLAIHLGTRNALLEPNGVRATAVKVEDDRQHLVVFVTVAHADTVLQDLRDNGQAAVTLVRPSDDRACQVKGTFVDVREARPEEPGVITTADHSCDPGSAPSASAGSNPALTNDDLPTPLDPATTSSRLSTSAPTRRDTRRSRPRKMPRSSNW